jgi:ABC-type transport system substrate-binding protein
MEHLDRRPDPRRGGRHSAEPESQTPRPSKAARATAVVLGLLVGCRPVPSAAPQRALRVLVAQDVRTLDPHVSFDTVSSVLLDNIFESLVRFDRSFHVTSDIALRWINPDDRTWRFFLDPTARFPDGEASVTRTHALNDARFRYVR